MGMGGAPGRLIPLLLHADNLSAEQQQKIDAVMSADRDTVHTLFGQLRDANKQLADKLLGPGAPQNADLTAIIQNIAQLRLQLTQHELSTVLAMRDVLTPDQLAKAAARHTQIEQLHQQMHDLLKRPQ